MKTIIFTGKSDFKYNLDNILKVSTGQKLKSEEER